MAPRGRQPIRVTDPFCVLKCLLFSCKDGGINSQLILPKVAYSHCVGTGAGIGTGTEELDQHNRILILVPFPVSWLVHTAPNRGWDRDRDQEEWVSIRNVHIARDREMDCRV